eukprot:6192997-Pyramimonas_sp.AAC.2
MHSAPQRAAPNIFVDCLFYPPVVRSRLAGRAGGEHILLSLLRLVPAPGIFSYPSSDWSLGPWQAALAGSVDAVAALCWSGVTVDYQNKD